MLSPTFWKSIAKFEKPSRATIAHESAAHVLTRPFSSSRAPFPSFPSPFYSPLLGLTSWNISRARQLPIHTYIHTRERNSDRRSLFRECTRASNESASRYAHHTREPISAGTRVYLSKRNWFLAYRYISRAGVVAFFCLPLSKVFTPACGA